MKDNIPIRYSVYDLRGVWQASYSTELGADIAYKYAKLTCKHMEGEVVAVFTHDPTKEINVFKYKRKKHLKK